MSVIIQLRADNRFCVRVSFSGFFSNRALNGQWPGTERAVLPKALRPCIISLKLGPKQQG